MKRHAGRCTMAQALYREALAGEVAEPDDSGDGT